jgi:hypothetical protein
MYKNSLPPLTPKISEVELQLKISLSRLFAEQLAIVGDRVEPVITKRSCIMRFNCRSYDICFVVSSQRFDYLAGNAASIVGNWLNNVLKYYCSATYHSYSRYMVRIVPIIENYSNIDSMYIS